MFEIELIKTIQEMRSAFSDRFFLIFADLIGIIGFTIAFIFIFVKNRKNGVIFAFIYAVTMIFNEYILKSLFNRTRPYDYSSEIMLIGDASSGQSFPSGHVLSICLILLFVYYFLIKDSYNKRLKINYLLISLCIIILSLIDRMYLGKHYLTDMTASILISLIAYFSFILITKCLKIFKYKQKLKKVTKNSQNKQI